MNKRVIAGIVYGKCSKCGVWIPLNKRGKINRHPCKRYGKGKAERERALKFLFGS